MWNQIEAEIHLHRHKTVIRACRGRQDPQKELKVREKPEIKGDDDPATTARKKRGIDDPRTVKLHRDKMEGLGISITVGCVNNVNLNPSDLLLGICSSSFIRKVFYSINSWNV